MHHDEYTDLGAADAACTVAIICGSCGEYGHRTLDCSHPPQPRPGHVALPDAHELAAELSAQEGIDLATALPLARNHLAHLTTEPPAEPEPKPIPGPRPLPPIDPLPRFVLPSRLRYPRFEPRSGRHPIVADALLVEADAALMVNISDRERCGYCTGPHADADCPLRRRQFVGPVVCLNCGQAHSIQVCPEIQAALRKVEAYLDPEADLIRQEQLAAGREQLRMLLAERVEIDGVDIPF